MCEKYLVKGDFKGDFNNKTEYEMSPVASS